MTTNKAKFKPNHQCCGSESESGSTCFWASRIRTLLSSRKNSKKNLDSYYFVTLFAWIRGSGSGSTPKCHGSATLLINPLPPSHQTSKGKNEEYDITLHPLQKVCTSAKNSPKPCSWSCFFKSRKLFHSCPTLRYRPARLVLH
jgi:hypothetical protein